MLINMTGVNRGGVTPIFCHHYLQIAGLLFSQMVGGLAKYKFYKVIVITGVNLASISVRRHILDGWGIRWRSGESTKLSVVNALKSCPSRIIMGIK